MTAILAAAKIPDEYFFYKDFLTPPLSLRTDNDLTIQTKDNSKLLMAGAGIGCILNVCLLNDFRKSSKIIFGNILFSSIGFLTGKCCNFDSFDTTETLLISGAMGDYTFSTWFKTTPYLLASAMLLAGLVELNNSIFSL